MKQVTFIWNMKDMQIPDELVGKLIRMFGHHSVDFIEEIDDQVMLGKIMELMFKRFGVGDMLEYIAFYFDTMASKYGYHTDNGIAYNNLNERLKKLIDYIPEYYPTKGDRT